MLIMVGIVICVVRRLAVAEQEGLLTSSERDLSLSY